MTQSENIITVTVVQPKYRHKEKPDESIRKFITAALDKAPENGIILFPEYSNAGGLSDIDSERRAMAYAGELLAYAAAAAKSTKLRQIFLTFSNEASAITKNPL